MTEISVGEQYDRRVEVGRGVLRFVVNDEIGKKILSLYRRVSGNKYDSNESIKYPTGISPERVKKAEEPDKRSVKALNDLGFVNPNMLYEINEKYSGADVSDQVKSDVAQGTMLALARACILKDNEWDIHDIYRCYLDSAGPGDLFENHRREEAITPEEVEWHALMAIDRSLDYFIVYQHQRKEDMSSNRKYGEEMNWVNTDWLDAVTLEGEPCFPAVSQLDNGRRVFRFEKANFFGP